MSIMEESVAAQLLKQAEGNRRGIHQVTQTVDKDAINDEVMLDVLKRAEANGRNFFADEVADRFH